MMRDLGLDFRSEDKYLANTRAMLPFLEDVDSYSAATMFEVFEHLPDPLATLEKLFERTDTVVFSTELLPIGPIDPNWWYFAWEAAQHVTFASRSGLRALAGRLDARLLSAGSTHILARGSVPRIRTQAALRIGKYAQLLVPIIQHLSSLSDSDRDEAVTYYRTLDKDYD
jgi:hypothetical protein